MEFGYSQSKSGFVTQEREGVKDEVIQDHPIFIQT